ncbi:MAG: ATP phosphoribosyltransferase [Anaerolineae bacterium]|nr:ATP phosphoribosyltransferase [Anaerolineae bacterium]
MRSGTVRLALPSKGQLGESTLQFFKACGLSINKTNPRQYTASIPALPEVEVFFQRSADIPRAVSQGDMDLGITGMDTLQEHRLEADANVTMLREFLGYGGCSLVVAVPLEWNIQNAAQLATLASERGGLRVATKFPNQTQQFLDGHGVAPVKIVLASGALEAMPTIGSADFISDLTATGTTLRDNHLRALDDGEILYSEASLVANPDAVRNAAAVQRVARRLLELFEGYLAGDSRYLVFANMRGESAEAVADRLFTQSNLGGLTGPTIAPIYSRLPSAAGHWFSVSVVVQNKSLYDAIQQLRSIGGSGVVVTPITYIFDEYPASCQRLDALIAGKEPIA